jgi:hypothetical protein
MEISNNNMIEDVIFQLEFYKRKYNECINKRVTYNKTYFDKNKDVINRKSKEYYDENLKNNEEYLKKKREYMRELNFKKQLEDENYIKNRNEKQKLKAREKKLLNKKENNELINTC